MKNFKAGPYLFWNKSQNISIVFDVTSSMQMDKLCSEKTEGWLVCPLTTFFTPRVEVSLVPTKFSMFGGEDDEESLIATECANENIETSLAGLPKDSKGNYGIGIKKDNQVKVQVPDYPLETLLKVSDPFEDDFPDFIPEQELEDDSPWGPFIEK